MAGSSWREPHCSSSHSWGLPGYKQSHGLSEALLSLRTHGVVSHRASLHAGSPGSPTGPIPGHAGQWDGQWDRGQRGPAQSREGAGAAGLSVCVDTRGRVHVDMRVDPCMDVCVWLCAHGHAPCSHPAGPLGTAGTAHLCSRGPSTGSSAGTQLGFHHESRHPRRKAPPVTCRSLTRRSPGTSRSTKPDRRGMWAGGRLTDRGVGGPGSKRTGHGRGGFSH